MRKVFKTLNFRDAPVQALQMIGVIIESYSFILRYKLWRGFFEHRWILLFTIAISVLFSMALYGDLTSFFQSDVPPDVAAAGLLDNVDVDQIKENISEEGKNALFSGGTKYLLLILLEVITFYFSVRTINILTERNYEPKFLEFVHAEKRMINVMIRSFIQGIIVQVFVYVGMLFLGLSNYTFVIMFFVYAFFMGYSFIDNYAEQFKKSIKESEYISRQHIGASTTLGIIASGLLYIPLLGPFFTPILGAIAAAIYGNRYNIENTKIPIEFAPNAS